MTIRWGVIGPGAIAAQFASAMTQVPDGQIVAVASRSMERANDYADRFAVGARFDTVEALVASDVDAVYVATPHAQHHADSLAALRAGKHVLCEKPLALNARQAREMVGAARMEGVFLMEAMWSRFLPAYRSLIDVIRDGRVGDPLVVEADFGFRMPVMPEHRLFDRSLGGGALLDLGIYPIQLCTLVLGIPEVVAAVGEIGSTGVDERVAAVLRHPGGKLGDVKAAITAPLPCRGRISGTDGWIDLPAYMHCPMWIEVGGAGKLERIDGGYEGEGLRFQLLEVHRYLEQGLLDSPVMPLAESVAIAEVMDAIREQIGVIYAGD